MAEGTQQVVIPQIPIDEHVATEGLTTDSAQGKQAARSFLMGAAWALSTVKGEMDRLAAEDAASRLRLAALVTS